MSAGRQPTGTAFALRDPLPWEDLAAIVRAAEQAGYTSLFLPEIAGRDVFVTLGALAGETRDLLLGTGVAPMRSRTLMLTAMSAATVHERSRGRHVLGLGTGGAGKGALEALRSRVLAVRTLLEGGTVEHDGEQLRLSLTLTLDTPAPIWISALGPRAMRLAGEVADGVILNWCTPERVAFARERIDEGAERAGRDPSSVTVSVYVRAWVGADEGEAMPVLRAATAQYASYPAYAAQFEQMGFGPEAAAAAEALRAGRTEEVPDALVRAMCAIGERAKGRLQAYSDAGADLPIVYPVALGEAERSVERTLSALAPS